jgi:hypothetical protein
MKSFTFLLLSHASDAVQTNEAACISPETVRKFNDYTMSQELPTAFETKSKLTRARQPVNESSTALALPAARINVVQTRSDPIQYLFFQSLGPAFMNTDSEHNLECQVLLYVSTDVSLAPSSFMVRLTVQPCLLLVSLSFLYSSSQEYVQQTTTIFPFGARPSLSCFPFVYICLFFYAEGVKRELYLLGGAFGSRFGVDFFPCYMIINCKNILEWILVSWIRCSEQEKFKENCV